MNKQNKYQIVSIGPLCSIGAIGRTVVTIQINFFLILPLPDETQEWKYFTQKFQIISQKKKKNPSEKDTAVLLSLEFTWNWANSCINPFLA